MNRAEVSEIKKLFHIKNCSVTRICGCYVDGEKEIKAQWQQPFLTMPEEELFKYLDIFRKCLSGTIGKTLTEVAPKQPKAAVLRELRDSKLKDKEQLEDFYQNIIDTYEYVGNYLILVIHDVYDIPGKTSDGITMEDASDEVYEYILACICPVNLSKPGLGYNSCEQCFTNLDRDWVVSAPELAVLYPAFNDRSEDLEKALYYARTMDTKVQDFAEHMFGYTILLTPKDEKATFNAIIEEVLGCDKNLADVREVIQAVEDMADEFIRKEEPKIGIEDIRDILVESGIKQDKINRLEDIFYGTVGSGTKLSLNNIVNRKDYVVATPRARISIDPEYKYDLSQRMIDGTPCLVLELRDSIINVNGIDVNVGRDVE